MKLEHRESRAFQLTNLRVIIMAAKEKIYLGQLAYGPVHEGEKIWLEKHSWDCGWYWGFGYIGNRGLHFHIDSLIKAPAPCEASRLFSKTKISDNDWWIIRDLFKQAYALKTAAEVYRHGGHQKSLPGVTDVIQNAEVAKQLNSDLEKVLDKAWEFISKTVSDERS